MYIYYALIWLRQLILIQPGVCHSLMISVSNFRFPRLSSAVHRWTLRRPVSRLVSLRRRRFHRRWHRRHSFRLHFETRFEANEHRRPKFGHLSMRNAEKTSRSEKGLLFLGLPANGGV